MAIVTAGEKGRNAFVGNRGIHYLCETVIRQTFRCEDALKVSKVCLKLFQVAFKLTYTQDKSYLKQFKVSKVCLKLFQVAFILSVGQLKMVYLNFVLS